MSTAANIIKAEDPQAEFCSAFVLAAVKKYEKEVGKFSTSTFQKMVLDGSQVLTVGGFFLLGFGPLNFVGVSVKKVEEEAMKICNKLQGLKIERQKRREVDEGITKDFETKFCRTFLEAAVIFYNVYEFQLQHIYLENKDKSLDGVGGLRKLGKIVGVRAFDHLTEIVQGAEKSIAFDENMFKRHVSKFTDWIIKEKLIFQLNSEVTYNLSECQIFNHSLPLFYREVNNEVWMRNGDMDTFFNKYQRETNYLRRPVQFESATFDEKNSTRIHLENLEISQYRFELPTSEFIAELLKKMEKSYLGPKIKLEAQVNEIHQIICQPQEQNPFQEIKVVTKFNNIDQNLYSNLMKPKLADDLQKVIEKVGAKKSATKIEDKMVVIHGVGGVGKSSFARWFATQKWEGNVWWINAETPESIYDSFEDFAHCLKIESKISSQNCTVTQQGQRLSIVLFDHIFEHKLQNVLLIYDNANQMCSHENDGAFGIFDYLPKISTTTDLALLPVILVTSQWSEWKIPSKDPIIHLQSWGEEMTGDFLRTRFDLCNFEEFPGSDLENSMKELHECLGGFPLATSIVASNIVAGLEEVEELQLSGLIIDKRSTQESLLVLIKQWLNMNFKELKNHSFSTGDSKNYPHTMETVWICAIERIKKTTRGNSKLALQLLGIMAFIPNYEISLARLYFTLYPQRLTTDVKARFRNSPEYIQMVLAVNILRKYSLIEIDMSHKVIEDDYDRNYCWLFFVRQRRQRVQIHRLVQQRTRDHLEQDDGNKAKTLAMAAEFAIQYDDSSRLRDKWKMIQELAEFQWPGETYKQFMTLIVAMKYKRYSEKFRLRIKEYLKTLKIVLEQRQINEYINLCDLALLYFDLRKITQRPWSFLCATEIKDYNRCTEKLEWILDQLQQYWKTHSFFYLGLDCLNLFVASDFTEGEKSKTHSWLINFFKSISETSACLPLNFNCGSMMQMAGQVEVSSTDRKRFFTQLAQALNGVDSTTLSPSDKNIECLWVDYFQALRYFGAGCTTFTKDKNMMGMFFTLFAKAVASIKQMPNSDNYRLLKEILYTFRHMAVYGDFVEFAFDSPEFMDGFHSLLDCPNFETNRFKWNLYVATENFEIYWSTLVLGFSLFSLAHQLGVAVKEETAQKFKSMVDQLPQKQRTYEIVAEEHIRRYEENKKRTSLPVIRFVKNLILTTTFWLSTDEVKTGRNFMDIYGHKVKETTREAVILPGNLGEGFVLPENLLTIILYSHTNIFSFPY